MMRYKASGKVFVATDRTIEEFLSNMLFGMADNARKVVLEITIGTPIFLHDMHNECFHGIFEARSPGRMNLNPLAFGGDYMGSPYPAQVQVWKPFDYPPVPRWLFQKVPGLFYDGTVIVDSNLDEQQVLRMYEIFNTYYVRQHNLPLPPGVGLSNAALMNAYNGPPLPRPPPFLGEKDLTYHHPRKEFWGQQRGLARRNPGFDRADDGRNTTIKFKFIPPTMNPSHGVDSLDAAGFQGLYNFFLLVPFSSNKPGTMTVNFVNREAAELAFDSVYDIRKFWPGLAGDVRHSPIIWAQAQGLEELKRDYPTFIVEYGLPSHWFIPPRKPILFVLPNDQSDPSMPMPRSHAHGFSSSGMLSYRAQNVPSERRHAMYQSQLEEGLDEGKILRPQVKAEELLRVGLLPPPSDMALPMPPELAGPVPPARPPPLASQHSDRWNYQSQLTRRQGPGPGPGPAVGLSSGLKRPRQTSEAPGKFGRKRGAFAAPKAGVSRPKKQQKVVLVYEGGKIEKPGSGKHERSSQEPAQKSAQKTLPKPSQIVKPVKVLSPKDRRDSDLEARLNSALSPGKPGQARKAETQKLANVVVIDREAQRKAREMAAQKSQPDVKVRAPKQSPQGVRKTTQVAESTQTEPAQKESRVKASGSAPISTPKSSSKLHAQAGTADLKKEFGTKRRISVGPRSHQQGRTAAECNAVTKPVGQIRGAALTTPPNSQKLASEPFKKVRMTENDKAEPSSQSKGLFTAAQSDRQVDNSARESSQAGASLGTGMSESDQTRRPGLSDASQQMESGLISRSNQGVESTAKLESVETEQSRLHADAINSLQNESTDQAKNNDAKPNFEFGADFISL